MIIFLNGQFVPEERATVSVFDRGFLYGDGLFESLLVRHGRPFRWRQHFERLQQGAKLLRLGIPFAAETLQAHAAELIRLNHLPDSILRLTLSRGTGPRGYSIRGANQPLLVMSLHAAAPVDPQKPPRWRVVTASVRVPANDLLAQVKTCNKLPQILARAEAEEQGADEALLLNTDGTVVEGASSNLFWVHRGTVCTAPLVEGLVAGVTRAVVLELCWSLGLRHEERAARPDELRQADGVFLTLSTLGVVPVVSLDRVPVAGSPLTDQLQRAYWQRVESETRG
ncbi:MAG: aminodeoxychorismate lyase [Verrucomicrobia bacterium]|nr:aminodeoxychorismate lyase [Verrucomicrobiota bacterium]